MQLLREFNDIARAQYTLNAQCRTVRVMKHRWLISDWHPDDPEEDPETGDYHLRDLEQKLRQDFGGDLWRIWGLNVTVPGAGIAAGYTRNEAGRYVLSAVMLVGDAITAEVLRKVPVAELENSINISATEVREEIDQLPPLKRAPGMDPEDFSRLVAEHYRTWSKAVPHPAGAMAADAGVSVGTVHNWLREARIRKFLPPAKRGKGS
ncbi:hypothetical protein ACIBG4_14950 [Nonomuraea sp. NPDC050383]|uniref:hypothetical protein n=1 Tax=Nonomuraea sp. NPDC050383 TaxID=3364362 RepID=UPI003799106C